MDKLLNVVVVCIIAVVCFVAGWSLKAWSVANKLTKKS
jgi:hypothetical protein